jgi:hypothetical protein
MPYKFKTPLKKSLSEIKLFFDKLNLEGLSKLSLIKFPPSNKMVFKEQYSPELIDLYRLYSLIFDNKRTTVLEFGCGWSSVIIVKALLNLKKKYLKSIKNLRRQNPFELFIIDNEKKYLFKTKKLIEKYLPDNDLKIHFHYSKVEMTKFNDRIASEYLSMPMCNPDFIYLDGPDQFNIKGRINNLNIGHKDFMPMQCDVLKIENFLQPGTIILADGRKANTRFLKNNFQRNWLYKEDEKYDQVTMLLKEKPLGIVNKKILDFYKNK